MLEHLISEQRNPNTMDLDLATPLELVSIMQQEDLKVSQAIASQKEMIALAITYCTTSLQQGGRMIYIGAGASGRIGLMDAEECAPTFGMVHGEVIALVAGSKQSANREAAEDETTMAESDLASINLNALDVVIALAASGRTPYALEALRYANKLGATTIGISCNPDTLLSKLATVGIEVVCGPEVLTGSTRLKAATAQKMVCNMLSTGTMVQLGKVYQNLMVDVQAGNEKLKQRWASIVSMATNHRYTVDTALYEASHYNAKTAIVMLECACEYEEAQAILAATQGHLRKALTTHR
ncbi:MAG: N-acetylmuramic acid 6-phosphate etherase [Erysipelotrichaceae bacterium]